MTREEIMQKAIEEAYAALDAGEVPVGAVVVCEGEIIASAHNEREALCDPTAHAEVLALRRAAKKLGRRRLSGCTLFVTLEPCPMCAGAIVMSEPDAVIFGAYDGNAGCAGSVYCLPEDPAFMHPVACSGGLMQEECQRPLRAFFDAKRW
ncbi:MAG: nucleoside deaminase [Clostridia bacterium]|nr:nucleoside deaminase [Clostridia bacterium]